MPGFERQLIFRGQRDDLLHFGEQLSIFGNGNKRAVFLAVFDLILIVECGHPDDFAPAASHQNHAFDGGRIDASHRAIQIDAAEDLDAGNFLADHVS